MAPKYEYDRSNDVPGIGGYSLSDEEFTLDTDKIYQRQQEDDIRQQLLEALSGKRPSSGNSAGEIAQREREAAQKTRGSAQPQATQMPRGGGGKIDTGPSTLVSAVHALGDPDAIRALGMAANNYGGGATGVLDSRDRLNHALSGGLGYDGGFSIGATRKVGPAMHKSASAWGTTLGQPFAPAKKRELNEFEKRAQAARQSEFERTQHQLDEQLNLRFEQARREQLLKQIQKLFARRGYGGNVRTSTTEGQQLANVGGLPVRIPTQTKVVEQMPIPWESILSLLR